MLRRMLLLASVALLVATTGCRHKCGKLFHKDDCCPTTRPSGVGPNSILLPPANVPTTPGGSPFPPPTVSPVPSVQPGPSGFLPPAAIPEPLPKSSGPDVLFPDPLPPGSSSSRPATTGANFLGAPVKPQTAEPPKATRTFTGLPGYTKVKDGLYAGGRPTLDGFDTLKKAGFRTVIFLHGAGADVNAVKDMASTRDLQFVAIETTPETLAGASKQFDRAATDSRNRPAYVFADDSVRVGAVWYLHFRNADMLDHDVARLRAKPLGYSTEGEEATAFVLAIQRVLETR